MNRPTTHLLDEDAVPFTVDLLAKLIREETEALLETYPQALSRQWTVSSIPKPREDTSERATGERPSDPTGDTALDPRRMAVRDTVVRSEKALRDAAAALRGSRLALERAITRFDGGDTHE